MTKKISATYTLLYSDKTWETVTREHFVEYDSWKHAKRAVEGYYQDDPAVEEVIVRDYKLVTEEAKGEPPKVAWKRQKVFVATGFPEETEHRAWIQDDKVKRVVGVVARSMGGDDFSLYALGGRLKNYPSVAEAKTAMEELVAEYFAKNKIQDLYV